MLSVPIGHVAGEDRCHHQRAAHANDADRVIENAIVSPGLQRFFDRLGEAEVRNPSPVLMHAVIISSGEKFLRAHRAQLVPIVRGHHVLSAFAAIQRQQGRVHTEAAAFICEHAAVFVIRMGHDHRDAGARMQFLQTLPEAGRSAVDRKRSSERLLVGNGLGGLGEDSRARVRSKAVKRLRVELEMKRRVGLRAGLADLRSAASLIAKVSCATRSMVSCVGNGYHGQETL